MALLTYINEDCALGRHCESRSKRLHVTALRHTVSSRLSQRVRRGLGLETFWGRVINGVLGGVPLVACSTWAGLVPRVAVW